MVTSLNNDSDIIKTEKKAYACPKCKSELDYRVHRSVLVKVLFFWLPLRRYLCYHCNRKYHVWE